MLPAMGGDGEIPGYKLAPMNTTTPTTALVGFDRVIPARFVTEYNSDKVKPCLNCGDDLVLGQAFAAQFRGKWYSYCAACAADFPAYCARAWRHQGSRIAALATVPNEVTDARDATYTALQAVVAAPTDVTTFKLGRSALRGLRAAIDGAEANERKVALAVDPIYLGLALATEFCTGKFRTAAESMIDQWERKGYLSPKQIDYAVAIGDAARKAESKGTPVVDWSGPMHDAVEASGLTDGYFAVASITGTNDLTFARIGTDNTGQRFVRHVVGGHPDLPVSLDWVTKLLAALIPDPVAAQLLYGQQIGRCGACHRHLTDQTSRDFGLGPHCRQAMGL